MVMEGMNIGKPYKISNRNNDVAFAVTSVATRFDNSAQSEAIKRTVFKKNVHLN